MTQIKLISADNDYYFAITTNHALNEAEESHTHQASQACPSF